LACVVLAAGESSRLGAPKQLVRRRVRPLLLRIVETAGEVVQSPIIVVLGAHAPRLRALLRRSDTPTRVVLNARWQDGLAASLRVGLDAAPRDARAVLVLLVDQPDVDARALGRLVTAWQRRPRTPVAAHYENRLGVPAILPRAVWRAARALRGDTGARALLRAAARVTPVEMPEAMLDIDTRDDLAKLR
jgi:CTP:molybdopterin cytidylyltransferase MocA